MWYQTDIWIAILRFRSWWDSQRIFACGAWRWRWWPTWWLFAFTLPLSHLCMQNSVGFATSLTLLVLVLVFGRKLLLAFGLRADLSLEIVHYSYNIHFLFNRDLLCHVIFHVMCPGWGWAGAARTCLAVMQSHVRAPPSTIPVTPDGWQLNYQLSIQFPIDTLAGYKTIALHQSVACRAELKAY